MSCLAADGVILTSERSQVSLTSFHHRHPSTSAEVLRNHLSRPFSHITFIIIIITLQTPTLNKPIRSQFHTSSPTYSQPSTSPKIPTTHPSAHPNLSAPLACTSTALLVLPATIVVLVPFPGVVAITGVTLLLTVPVPVSVAFPPPGKTQLHVFDSLHVYGPSTPVQELVWP